MKKEPGINGNWIELSRDERLSNAGLSSFVTLGTPAAIQVATSMTDAEGSGWLLNVIYWVYCAIFWLASTAVPLFRRKRWEWTSDALAEQRRYLSDTRVKSKIYWGHWWVRFPIGLLFLSAGIHGLTSTDFSIQWVSFVLLLLAFITPFVFMAELALLPLFIVLMLAMLGLVSVMPFSVIIMLAIAGMVTTVVMAQNRRNKLPPKPKSEKPVKDDKSDQAAQAEADEPADAVTEPEPEADPAK
jgi:hypothetical protein